MSRRKYSDREKAEALAVYDSCGNLTETARITGIPDSTLSAWINGTNGLNDDIPDLREFKKLELSAKLDAIAHQCAGLLPGKLPEASVREIVGAMGQSIEKAQLLRGQPTEITATLSRRSLLEDQLRRLRARHDDDSDYDRSVGQLRQLFTDQTDPAYDPLLDYTKHPENWPEVASTNDLDPASKAVN